MIASLLLPLLLQSAPSASPSEVYSPRLVAEFGSDDFRHVGRLEDIAYSESGHQLVSVSVDGVLKLWETDAGRELASYSHPNGVPLFSVAYLDAQTVLVGTGLDHIQAMTIGTGSVLLPCELDTYGLADLADSGGGISVSPDGGYVAQWMMQGNVGLVLAEIKSDHSRGARTILTAEGFVVNQVAWSDTGELLAVLTTNPLKALGRDGSEAQDATRVLIFDTRTAKEVARISTKETFLTAIDFSMLGQQAGGEALEGLLVTGSSEGCQVWDLASARKLSSMAGEIGQVMALDVRDNAAGNSDLVVSSTDGHTQSWKLFEDRSPELVADFPGYSSLGRVTLQPGLSELKFAAIEGRTINQWSFSVPSNQWFADPAIARHDGIVSALSASQGRIASAGYDGAIYVWEYTPEGEAADGKLQVQSKIRLVGSDHLQSLVLDAELSSDGSRLVSCGKDGYVRLWELGENERFGEQLGAWSSGSDGSFTSTNLSPDSSLVTAVSANGSLWVRDALSGVLLRKFEGLRGMDFSSGFSGDGRLFAVGSTGARIYDAKTWEQVLEINDLGSPIMDLVLSPNGERIAIATAGRLLVVRDVASGELIKAWTDFQGRPTAICWVTNEVLVAAGPGDGGFRVLKAASKGKPGDSAIGGTGILVPSPRGSDIKALALLPSGKVVAAGNNGFLHIWDQIR